MRLYGLLLLVATVLYACQSQNDTAIQNLDRRITSIEARLDSLIAHLSFSQTSHTTPQVKKKTRQKTAQDVYAETYVPTPSKPSKSSYKESSYESSWRCQATTKKGTQCKRSARSGGYCWQHGG